MAAGRTDDQIRAYFAERLGEQYLLTPSSSGIGSLTWVLPVVALVVAFGGLGFAFASGAASWPRRRLTTRTAPWWRPLWPPRHETDQPVRDGRRAEIRRRTAAIGASGSRSARADGR